MIYRDLLLLSMLLILVPDLSNGHAMASASGEGDLQPAIRMKKEHLQQQIDESRKLQSVDASKHAMNMKRLRGHKHKSSKTESPSISALPSLSPKPPESKTSKSEAGPPPSQMPSETQTLQPSAEPSGSNQPSGGPSRSNQPSMDPTPCASCDGFFACASNTGSVGTCSCKGLAACSLNSGNIIGPNSCIAPADVAGACCACANNSGQIGEGSCIGDSACAYNSGQIIAAGACIGERACCGNTQDRDTGECTTPYSCCDEDNCNLSCTPP